MLDIRGGSAEPAENSSAESENQVIEESKEEIPRPQPKLEVPSLEPEPNYLGIFSIITAVIVVVAGIFLYILKETKASALKTKEAEAQELQQQLSISSIKELDDKVQVLQTGLQVFQSALAGKVYWSKLFLELEKATPKNVKLTNFSLDEKKVVKVTGQTDTHQAVAKLIRSLQESSKFTDIKLISSALAETGEGNKIDFALTLKLEEANFKETNNAQSQ